MQNEETPDAYVCKKMNIKYFVHTAEVFSETRAIYSDMSAVIFSPEKVGFY